MTYRHPEFAPGVSILCNSVRARWMGFPPCSLPLVPLWWGGSTVNEHLKMFMALHKLTKRSHLNTDSDIEGVTTYFHSFIVLESTEGKPITKLSPFAIKWYLSANVAPKSVKTVCNNTVEVTKKKYAELLLLKMNTLYNMKIKTCPHWSLNTSRGVVRNPELSACRSEEIKKTSIGYRENNNKKNDQLIDTNTYILTFDTPKLPPKLKIGYTIVKVDIYIYPQSTLMLQLPKVWAHESWCTKKTICKKSGKDGSDHPKSTANY